LVLAWEVALRVVDAMAFAAVALAAVVLRAAVVLVGAAEEVALGVGAAETLGAASRRAIAISLGGTPKTFINA